MTKELTTVSIADLFAQYDAVTGKIAIIEENVKTDKSYYPSVVMSELVDLHLEKWHLRRQLNTAYAEQDKAKSLWNRIFKK